MDIFEIVRNQLKQKFIVLEERGLQPFERDHALFAVRKK